MPTGRKFVPASPQQVEFLSTLLIRSGRELACPFEELSKESATALIDHFVKNVPLTPEARRLLSVSGRSSGGKAKDGLSSLSPIPAIYRGHKFRRMLEGEWAYFFDVHGIDWEQGPVVSGVSIPVEFALPELAVFVKVWDSPFAPKRKELLDLVNLARKLKPFTLLLGGNPAGFSYRLISIPFEKEASLRRFVSLAPPGKVLEVDEQELMVLGDFPDVAFGKCTVCGEWNIFEIHAELLCPECGSESGMYFHPQNPAGVVPKWKCPGCGMKP